MEKTNFFVNESGIIFNGIKNSVTQRGGYVAVDENGNALEVYETDFEPEDAINRNFTDVANPDGKEPPADVKLSKPIFRPAKLKPADAEIAR
jgi:hypothetical protein